MSKKIIICLFYIFLIIGCTKSEKLDKKINTIIEEDRNILVGINYPVTGYKYIDSLIKKDIENTYNEFKYEYESFNSLTEKSELNIDYTYELIDNNYINICVNVFIDSSKLANPYNYIKSYIYDINKNKLITLKDLIDENSLDKFVSLVNIELIKNYNECIILDELKKKIIPEYRNFELITFDTETITVYFNPGDISASYCDIISVEIPISDLNLKIEIKEEKKETVANEVTIPNKIIDPNKKVVALTFDDGPSKYTEKIVEYLHSEGASATFFILGNKVEIYKDTLKKSIKYGNELGNHSYNHKWLTRLETNDLLLQIDKTQAIIYENIGYTPITFRPTYGSLNNKIKNNIKLDIILWNVDTMDWKYKSVDKIVSRATNNIKDGDIILMHDTYERTYKAVMKLVPILKKQGFEFVTVSELKEINLLREIQK